MTENMEAQCIDLFEKCLVTTDAGVNLFMTAEEVQPVFKGSEVLSEFKNGLTVREELEQLKADLARLGQGWKLSTDDLASAILLENWGVYFHEGEPLWRIVGDCSGATAAGVQAIANGRQMVTLQVLAIDDDFTWARDRHGFYKLGIGV